LAYILSFLNMSVACRAFEHLRTCWTLEQAHFFKCTSEMYFFCQEFRFALCTWNSSLFLDSTRVLRNPYDFQIPACILARSHTCHVYVTTSDIVKPLMYVHIHMFILRPCPYANRRVIFCVYVSTRLSQSLNFSHNPQLYSQSLQLYSQLLTVMGVGTFFASGHAFLFQNLKVSPRKGPLTFNDHICPSTLEKYS
jgi:hypothetical protein